MGFGISGILIFISLVIIYNTIRLIIYSYKEEIQVMRLIGASNFYARGPFLIEGILYGIISGIFSIFITWAIIYFTTDLLKQIFILDLNKYFSDHILEISGSLILGGVAISFISTYFTVAKYLKIKEDN
jgi:cell division transport system permease protein